MASDAARFAGMRALSIRAPWWWSILHDGKDVENRNWRTNFRGRVLIHASSWWKAEEVEGDSLAAKVVAYGRDPGRHLNGEQFRRMRHAGGHIVGSVEIVDCVDASSSPWFFGRYGFVLRVPLTLETPIPCKGALGFFTPQFQDAA